jgi:ABC-2 type transport system permease protein
MELEGAPNRWSALVGEIRKLPAFFRRDLLVMWSYRAAFVSDWVNLVVQVMVFYFVGRLVDPSQLPAFGGDPTSYLEFVAIGIAIGSFMQIGLGRIATMMRQEQLMGTLEALLTTPSAPMTLQIGSVAYDLVYVPLRTLLFLGLVSGLLDVHFELSGVAPTIALLLVFIPLVWGLGIVAAAGVMTFRRGAGVVGLGATVLTIASGAYFPITVFPGWLQSVVRHNPIQIAFTSAREALLGGAGWREIVPSLLVLAPMAALTLMLGVVAFRLALRRERRRGSLGLY